jgi:hypothetical protein
MKYFPGALTFQPLSIIGAGKQSVIIIARAEYAGDVVGKVL